jgi:hypothetical protein
MVSSLYVTLLFHHKSIRNMNNLFSFFNPGEIMGPSSVSGIGLLDCVGWWFSAGLDPAFPMGESLFTL